MARHVVVFLLLAAVGVVFAQGPENQVGEVEVAPEHRFYRQMPTRCGHVTTYSSLQPRFMGGIHLRGGTIYTFGAQPRSVEIVFQQSNRITDLAGLLNRISERESVASQIEQGSSGQAAEGQVSDPEGRKILDAEQSFQHARAMIFQMHPLAHIGHRIAEMDRMLELRSQLMRGQAGMPSEGIQSEWSTDGEEEVQREVMKKRDNEVLDALDSPMKVALEWIPSPVESMVSQATIGVNKFLDDASILSVVLVGGMMGAAFALFLRLLLVCFSALWDCSPEEESMIVILTKPDEKETPLLHQKNVETVDVEDVESGLVKYSSDYKPPVVPTP